MKYFDESNYYLYIFIFVLAVFVISMLVTVTLYFTTKFEKTITIKDKYTRYRRKGSNYNVVDTENNIYQIGNLWFKFDFNRAEDYNKLDKGKTYKVKGYGVRIPMIDMYKKIYEIE